jgi:hypothetical protein
MPRLRDDTKYLTLPGAKILYLNIKKCLTKRDPASINVKSGKRCYKVG